MLCWLHLFYKNQALIRYIILSTLLLSACHSNQIYLDEKTQMICSESNKGIRHLSIGSPYGSDSYSIKWDSEENPPEKLSINPLTKGYVLTKDWYNNPMKPEELKLKKDSVYLIDRSGGDASPCEIEVIAIDENNHLKFIKEH